MGEAPAERPGSFQRLHQTVSPRKLPPLPATDGLCLGNVDKGCIISPHHHCLAVDDSQLCIVWPLPPPQFECPSLLNDFTVPKFFTEDLLSLVGPAEDAWPSLIVGAKGTQSGLHIDNNYFPFWLALYRGAKKVRILLANDTSLHAEYFDHDSLTFDVDLFKPEEPEWRNARVYETTLKPGQVLYIPHGAPHGAKNLEDTIAISGNFLDKHTLPLHQKFCKTNLDAPKCAKKVLGLYEAHPGRTPTTDLPYWEHRGKATKEEWCEYIVPGMQAGVEQAEDGSETWVKMRRYHTQLQKYCSGEAESSAGEDAYSSYADEALRRARGADGDM